MVPLILVAALGGIISCGSGNLIWAWSFLLHCRMGSFQVQSLICCLFVNVISDSMSAWLNCQFAFTLVEGIFAVVRCINHFKFKASINELNQDNITITFVDTSNGREYPAVAWSSHLSLSVSDVSSSKLLESTSEV